MRITDAEGNRLDRVYLALTDAEARELADALGDLQAATPPWHAHVADAEHQTEVTIAREDDSAAQRQRT